MELIEVDVVATPGEAIAACVELDAGDVGDGAGGGVIAGDPLRHDEAVVAGFDGKIDLGVEEAARGFGEIGGDLDGSLLGQQHTGTERGEGGDGGEREHGGSGEAGHGRRQSGHQAEALSVERD